MLADPQITLSAFDRVVAQKGLNGFEIHSSFQKMGGKTVAKRVRACRLGDPGVLHGLFHRLLQHRLMQMVPASLSRYSVSVMASCRKHPLPAPFLACVWIFSLERVGQCDSAQTAIKIALVLSLTKSRCLKSGSFTAA